MRSGARSSVKRGVASDDYLVGTFCVCTYDRISIP